MCNLKKILEVKQLNKKYSIDGNRKFELLKNIALKINEAECVSFMRASGSGKSTLI